MTRIISKNFFLVFIVSASFANNIYAQFNNSKYPFYGDFVCNDLDSNGNIFYILSSGAQNYLCKSDQLHQQILWAKQLPDTANNLSLKIYDDEIYIVASYYPQGLPSYIVLTKLDAAGNVIWAKKIFSPYNINALSMLVTSQKKIYLGTGVCAYFNLVLCLDPLGNLLWANRYDFTQGRGFITSIDESYDGNLIITSSSIDLSINHKIFVLFKIDTSGYILWDKFYEVPFFSNGDVQRSSSFDSNNNMFFNWNFSDSSGARYNLMLMADVDGDIIWVRKYSVSSPDFNSIFDFAFDGNDNLYVLNQFSCFSNVTPGGVTIVTGILKLNSQNGYIMNVLTDTTEYGPASVWEYFLKITYQNPDRLVLFGEGYGSPLIVGMDTLGNGVCNFVSTSLVPESFSFITRGYALNPQPTSLSVSDTLTDWNEHVFTLLPYCSTIGINDIPDDFEISIFPNPATAKVTLSLTRATTGYVRLHNVLGSIMIQKEINSNGFSFDLSDYPKGIYFVTLTDNAGNRFTRKVIKI